MIIRITTFPRDDGELIPHVDIQGESNDSVEDVLTVYQQVMDKVFGVEEEKK